MIPTIVRLTFATLFGHRRGLLLFILPGVLLGLSVLLSVTMQDTSGIAAALLKQFGLAVILPLVALLAGTGAIATEIDDGSIVYLLSKPIKRHTIVVTKALVAIGTIAVLGALPILLAGLILDPSGWRTAVGFGVGALVAGIAYTAIFLALSVVTANAVTIGLFYALLWESVMGQYVAGARVLSVQQWALAIVQTIAGSNDIDSAVEPPVGFLALVVVTVLGLALAISRLRSLTLSSAE
jgi:ABC-2 type transport system permease protein